MALKSQKHGLTAAYRDGDLYGWIRRVNGKPKWMFSVKEAPTPEIADDLYEQRFTDLWTAPAPTRSGQLNIGDLGDAYLTNKKKSIGRIDQRTYDECQDAIQDFIDLIGDDAIVDDITPADFQKVRAALSKRFGPHRLKKWILLIRSMFKWASLPPLRLRLPHFGDSFGIPTRKEFRVAAKASKDEDGPRVFSPDEIRKLIGKASPKLKAMILLAINGGMGNRDIADLTWKIIDREPGHLDYARGKTGVERRFPLWPETVKAIKAIPRTADLVFVTRFGKPYIADVGKKHKDQIALRFATLCESAKVRPIGFYSLRRTFRTIADEKGDQRAVARIMGHLVEDVSSLYVEHISDQRLQIVVSFVSHRLGVSQSVRKAASKKAARPARGASRSRSASRRA